MLSRLLYHVSGEMVHGQYHLSNGRLNLENVLVYNSIEACIKVVEITHVICSYICRERHNVYKVFTEELIRILSSCLVNYNHVISLSNSLKTFNEIFTEGSFQILLDMDPNDSMRGFGVFVQSIGSMESEFCLKLKCFRNKIEENTKMIKYKIYQIKDCKRKCNDNRELSTHLRDLNLFLEINKKDGYN